MSENQMQGSGAAAVGAHSKDAMQSGAMPAGRPQGVDPSAVGSRPGQSDDVMTKAQDMAGQARGMADDAMGRAREAVNEYGAQAGQMTRQAGEGLSQAGEYVGGRVREEPLLALLGAGALGFALGLLIGRR